LSKAIENTEDIIRRKVLEMKNRGKADKEVIDLINKKYPEHTITKKDIREITYEDQTGIKNWRR
jgi:hypothetical protein